MKWTIWLTSIALFGMATPWVQAEDYDTAAAVAKLRRIGEAIQAFRATKVVKPVSQRNSFADCGLPQSPTQFCFVRDKAWSLPQDMSTFQVSAPHKIYQNGHVHFTKLYYEGAMEQRLPSMRSYYVSRGENLPVMADLNINPESVMYSDTRIVKAIILRLNGQVEIVEFDRTVPLDLLNK